MTGTEIKELNTEIRGGREMDDTIFYILANTERRRIEGKRPWRKLATKDTSQSTSTSDTFSTVHTLPSRFIRFSSAKRKIQLVSGSDIVTLEEIQLEALTEYQNTVGYFAIDHGTGQYFVTGQYQKNYTHYIYFCQSQVALTAESEWVLGGDDFGSLLAFAVAVIDESGMDYDAINAAQANGNAITARTVERTMTAWDDQLARSALGV